MEFTKHKITKENGIVKIEEKEKEKGKEKDIIKLSSILNPVKITSTKIGSRKFSKIIPSAINNILKVAYDTKGYISVNSNTLDEVMEDLLEQKIHTTRKFEGVKRDDNDIIYLDKAILKLMMYREYIYNKSKK